MSQLPQFDEAIIHKLTLPPLALRKGSPLQQQDRHYVANAVTLVDSIHQFLGIASGGSPYDFAGKRIFDLGCGPLRLLTGLQARQYLFAHYQGVDVQSESIEWANQHFSHLPTHFYTINFQNDRYNPEGHEQRLHLPEADGAWDLIVLRSVFTHMRWHHIVDYLRELKRILATAGFIYFSAFAELDVAEEEENPEDYRGLKLKATPLHRVCINRHRLEAVAFELGLRLRVFADDVLGQSTFVFTHHR